MRLTLKQSDHPLPHAHVHVRLGGLEVVVQVLAEAGQQRHSLLLPPPVHVLREDNFFSRFHKNTHKRGGQNRARQVRFQLQFQFHFRFHFRFQLQFRFWFRFRSRNRVRFFGFGLGFEKREIQEMEGGSVKEGDRFAGAITVRFSGVSGIMSASHTCESILATVYSVATHRKQA